MRKSAFLTALLMLFVAFLAVPAMAQWTEVDARLNENFGFLNHQVNEHVRDQCARHMGTGDRTDLEDCQGVMLDGYGRVVGRNPNAVRFIGWQDPGYAPGNRNMPYSYGYNRRPSGYGRSGYGNQPYGYEQYPYGGYPPYYESPSLGIPGNAKTLGAILGGAAGYIATRNSSNHARRDIATVGGVALGLGIGAIVDHNNNRHRELQYREGSDPDLADRGRYGAPTPIQPPQQRQPTAIVTNRTGECLSVNGQRLENHDTVQITDVSAVRTGTLKGSTCQVRLYPTGQASTGEMTYDLACPR